MKARSKKAAPHGQQQLDFSSLLSGLSGLEGDLATPQGNYTVSELTQCLEEAIESHPVLGKSVTVEGELSNVKRSSRGHVYFTLKDEQAAMGGILWASTANRLSFELKDGLAVYVTGRVEVYAPSGSYSLVGSKIEPVGVGALQLAFQQIKARLEAEGLFMEDFKQPLPDFPERIGLVTSSTGAVIHDMLRVIRRKNPLVHVILAPVKVQGDEAATEIAQAIRELNHPHYQLDALIVARGGGSFEDLFCFSEEPVVRAVFESQVPVVTGIGHEPDFSLADAAADYSASTPTAAADWLVPDLQVLLESHAVLARDLLREMAETILYYEQTLDVHASHLVERHQQRLQWEQSGVMQQQERLLSAFRLYFQQKEQYLAQTGTALNAYNPLATLARGYGIVTDEHRQVIHSIHQVKPEALLQVRVEDGVIQCEVKATTPLGTP